MEMHRNFIFLCVLLSTQLLPAKSMVNGICFQMSEHVDSIANNENYVSLLERQLKENDELETYKKELKDSLNLLEKTYKKLKEEHESLLKEIKKKDNQKKKIEDKSPEHSYLDLLEKKKRLLSSIATTEKQLGRQRDVLEELDEQMKELGENKAQLDKVKNEVSTHLIKEYGSYVESSFSQLLIEKLEKIKAECAPYTIDRDINSFVVKIGTTIQNKKMYDRIIEVLHSPYKKSDIDYVLDQLSKVNNCSSVQKDDFLEQRSQLVCFEDGVAAFKEFINNLNRCREGVSYKLSFFRDDKEQIMPIELEDRINNKLFKVPYLKNKYDMFMKEFEENPNGHSLIEEEILGL